MATIPDEPERTNRSMTEVSGLTYNCTRCSGTVRRIDGSLACRQCDHVPRHGSD